MAEDIKLKQELEEKKALYSQAVDPANEEATKNAEKKKQEYLKKDQVLNCVYQNTKQHRNHLQL